MHCECVNWARTDFKLMTNHHKNCPKYDPEQDALDIINGLIRGIECWANDEDGVHYDCWEAYKKAMHFVGRSSQLKSS